MIAAATSQTTSSALSMSLEAHEVELVKHAPRWKRLALADTALQLTYLWASEKLEAVHCRRADSIAAIEAGSLAIRLRSQKRDGD
ncbi:hypothetical protein TSMEX_008376 [Taenia solium]|eukprot:TsM_000043900 transcript=TsM_000043900 gene=TsM_000043900